MEQIFPEKNFRKTIYVIRDPLQEAKNEMLEEYINGKWGIRLVKRFGFPIKKIYVPEKYSDWYKVSNGVKKYIAGGLAGILMTMIPLGRPIDKAYTYQTSIHEHRKTKYPGDFTGDLIVDENDLKDFEKHFGAKIGDKDYNEEFDLNRDGEIDGIDLIELVGRLWGDHRYGDDDNDNIINLIEYEIGTDMFKKNSAGSLRERFGKIYDYFSDMIGIDWNNLGPYVMAMDQIDYGYRYWVFDVIKDAKNQPSHRDGIIDGKLITLSIDDYLNMFSRNELTRLVKLNDEFFKIIEPGVSNYDDSYVNIFISQIDNGVDPSFLKEMYEMAEEIRRNEDDEAIFNMIINQPSTNYSNFDVKDIFYEVWKKRHDIIAYIPRITLTQLTLAGPFVDNKGLLVQIPDHTFNTIKFETIKNNLEDDKDKVIDIFINYLEGIKERIRHLDNYSSYYKNIFGYYPSDTDKLPLHVLLFLGPTSSTIGPFLAEENSKHKMTLLEVLDNMYNTSEEQENIMKILTDRYLLSPKEMNRLIWRHMDWTKPEYYEALPKNTYKELYKILTDTSYKSAGSCTEESMFMKMLLDALVVPGMEPFWNKFIDGKAKYGGHMWTNYYDHKKEKFVGVENHPTNSSTLYQLELPFFVYNPEGKMIANNLFFGVLFGEEGPYWVNEIWKDAGLAIPSEIILNLFGKDDALIPGKLRKISKLFTNDKDHVAVFDISSW